jgi:hypothetical protein
MRNIMTTYYTLKKFGETDEHHLFECKMSQDKKTCSPVAKSLCKGMSKEDGVTNVFIGKEESEARAQCAKVGRSVCGNCVSQLYTTY